MTYLTSPIGSMGAKRTKSRKSTLKAPMSRTLSPVPPQPARTAPRGSSAPRLCPTSVDVALAKPHEGSSAKITMRIATV